MEHPDDTTALFVLFLVVVFKVPLYLYQWLRHQALVKEIKSVRAEVKELKATAAPLNTPETFVRYAKLNREASRKEKRLSELGSAIQQLNQMQITKYLLGIQVVLVFWSLWRFGNEPITELGFSLGRFFGSMVNRGGSEESLMIGDIRFLPWIFLANSAVHALLQTFFPFDYACVVS